MNLIERIVSLKKRDDAFRIYHLTDWHLGSAFCDEKLLREDIERVASDENGFWIGGGDYADFINRSDKRHRESTLAKWLWGKDDLVEAQINRIIEYMQPIRDKCLGLVNGNHEDTILHRYERDVYQAIVERATSNGAHVRLGYKGFIVIRWRYGEREHRAPRDVWSTNIFVHHGHGGGILEGGDALMLGRVAKWYDCDVAFIGHRHRQAHVMNVHIGPSARAKEIVEMKQLSILSPGYLKSFGRGNAEMYAEKLLSGARPRGCSVVEFVPSERKLKLIV